MVFPHVFPYFCVTSCQFHVQNHLILFINFSSKLYNCKLCKKLQNFQTFCQEKTCSSVNDSSTDNVKALFRRAKAHMGAWNPQQAREDLTRVMQLDHSLMAAVQKELKQLEEMERNRDEEDKSKLKGKIF